MNASETEIYDFGLQIKQIRWIIEQVRSATPEQFQALGAWYAARSAARVAALDAAWYTVRDSGDTVLDAAWYAVGYAFAGATQDAVRAVLVADLIDKKHVDALTRPLVSVFGPIPGI